MTAKQKANQARFKKVVAEAKKLRKKNPKLTQAQAVKQAWAISYSKKKVGAYHKDTKSHNVNIRVVSGIKVNRKPGKIGALPVDFTGSVLGLRFRVYNQFNLDGSVTLQVVENTPGGDLIANIDGRTGEVETASAKFWGKIDGKERQRLTEKDTNKVKKTIKDFLQNLHKEVKQYNSGKDTRTKKGQRLNVKATPKVRKGPKDQIKDILRTEKKRLKYGYTIVPGKVMSGVKRDSGYIGRSVIKKFTLSELKKLNPIYFEKGKDKAYGVYARKLMISNKLQSQVMIEAQKQYFGNDVFRSYVVRLISPSGEIDVAKRFETLFGAADYIGKNIVL